ncbi:MAG: SpoIIE family protein phosphatase, partial [Calditrichia bacterium]|nr:SpoIIE family protein phosphatase [Calditrichia bacterium]
MLEKEKLNTNIFVFYISVFLFYSFAFSQVVVHKHLHLEDGLVQSQIRTIFEDSHGYLWIGTMNGISRWDGNSFKNYYPYEALPSSIVYKFYEMKNGLILAGTHNGIAAIQGDSIIKVNIFDKLKDLSIADICISENGKMFVGTWGAGLFIIDGHEIDTLNTKNGLSDNFIHDLEFDYKGNLLIGTDLGVNILEGDSVKIYKQEDGLWDNFVHSIIKSKDGILLGTNSGVNILRDGKIIKLYENKQYLFNDVMTMYQSSDGTLYCGTWGQGAIVIKDDKVYTLKIKNGLISNHIFTFYEDKHKQIYIGQDGGLSIYKPGLMEIYDNKYMENPVTWSILQTSTGEYLFGTTTGLEIFDGKSFKNVCLPKELKMRDINTLTETFDGLILIGTYYGIYQLKNSKLVRNPLFNDLNNIEVYDIKQHKNGNLYIATNSRGLFEISNRKLKNYNTGNILPTNLISTIHINAEGKIYLATDGYGVVVLDRDSVTVLNENKGLLNNIVYSVQEYDDNELWICTDEGLSIYKNGIFKNIKKSNDISFYSTLWVLEDNQKRKYLGTEIGLLVLEYSKDSIFVRRLTTEDGLASIEINQGACLKDRDGSIWFGTIKGISHYFPENNYQVKSSPKVRINNIFVMDKEVPFNNEIQSLSFKHDHNYIRFEYSGIDLTAFSKMKYQHKLSGIDPQWIISTRTSVQYTNLNPGEYIFEVKACNSWGIWSKPEQLKIIIHPAWWATIWAYIIYALFIISIATWFVNYRVKREREIGEYKEAQLKAKAAEADKKVVIAEKKRRDEELERAREMQLMMLPDKSPKIPFADIEVYLETAREVGGAYYDFFIQNEESFYAIIGDASGHGMPAGMMVSITKSSLKTMGHRPTHLILKRLNYVLKDIIPKKLQMSLNVLIIQKDKIEFSSAAMPPIMIYRHKNST